MPNSRTAVVSVRSLRCFLAKARQIAIDSADACSGWGGRCRPETPCEIHRKIAEALQASYEEGLLAAWIGRFGDRGRNRKRDSRASWRTPR